VIKIYSILLSIIIISCCPEIRQQETSSVKRLIEIRQDTVYVDRIIPKIEITDESATFVTHPSIETIDTVIRAKETLRDYKVRITRATKVEDIAEDGLVKKKLVAAYRFDFSHEKPDSLFNEVTSRRYEYYRQRPWYEIPLYILTAILAFALGYVIRKSIGG
jgi:hypothetical protein